MNNNDQHHDLPTTAVYLPADEPDASTLSSVQQWVAGLFANGIQACSAEQDEAKDHVRSLKPAVKLGQWTKAEMQRDKTVVAE